MLAGAMRAIFGRTIQVGISPNFLAFGTTLSGGLLGALGQGFLADPSATPAQPAFQFRIWSVVIAIGGIHTTLQSFNWRFSPRAICLMFRDGLALLMAYWGAQSGDMLLKWWAGT